MRSNSKIRRHFREKLFEEAVSYIPRQESTENAEYRVKRRVITLNNAVAYLTGRPSSKAKEHEKGREEFEKILEKVVNDLLPHYRWNSIYHGYRYVHDFEDPIEKIRQVSDSLAKWEIKDFRERAIGDWESYIQGKRNSYIELYKSSESLLIALSLFEKGTTLPHTSFCIETGPIISSSKHHYFHKDFWIMKGDTLAEEG